MIELSLERNNTGNLFIGVSYFDGNGVITRASVLSVGMADGPMTRAFDQLLEIIDHSKVQITRGATV